MTRDNGRCVIVPVSLAGLVLMWVAAVALLSWDTLGGADVIGKWGLLASAGAAAWTVIYGLARHYQMLRSVFELGGKAGVRGIGR